MTRKEYHTIYMKMKHQVEAGNTSFKDLTMEEEIIKRYYIALIDLRKTLKTKLNLKGD